MSSGLLRLFAYGLCDIYDEKSYKAAKNFYDEYKHVWKNDKLIDNLYISIINYQKEKEIKEQDSEEKLIN